MSFKRVPTKNRMFRGSSYLDELCLVADCGPVLGCLPSMATGAPAWMTAVPCRRTEGLHDAAPRELGLRDLSTRDRREMASLAAAALATAIGVLVTGSFAAPEEELAARPLSVVIAAVPQPPRASAAFLLTARANPAITRAARRSLSDHLMLVASNAAEPAEVIAPSPHIPDQYQYVRANFASPAVRKGQGAVETRAIRQRAAPRAAVPDGI